MIVGMDNILAWFRTSGAPYWKLKSSDGERANLYGTCPDDTVVTMSASEERLKQILNMYSRNFTKFFLQCWKTQGQKKEWFQTVFELQPGEGSGGFNQQNPGIGFLTPTDVATQVNNALEKYKAAQELETLKKENKELKTQQSNDSVGRVFTRLEPHINLILEKVFKTKSHKVAGEKQNLSEEEYQKRVEKAAEEWAAADPEGFVAAIESVAKLAKENPDKYKTAKNFL